MESVSSGELRSVVIEMLNIHGELSLKDLLSQIESKMNRKYAQTTIATVLSRLEDDALIVGEKKRKAERKKTYYRLKENAHVKEANLFLKEYMQKFGNVGIKHLGDMMGVEIDEIELDTLRSKIYDE